MTTTAPTADLALGTALGDLNVPDHLLDALEARRP